VIHYRRTQVSWPAVVPAAAVLLIVTGVLFRTDLHPELAFVVGAMSLILGLFATMTVIVDDRAIEARFGVGIVRKRVPFDRIRSCRVVRNPWYFGWGVHLFPGGVLYNASGLDAIELGLENGRRVRIGSPEPDVLVAMLRRMAPAISDRFEAGRISKVGIYVGLGLAAAACAVAVLTIRVGLQPPVVEVSPQAFEVRNGLYRNTVPLRDITSATLDERIPRVGLKTNGFAAGGTLRGTFRVDSWGSARLYVNLQNPPFLVIRSQQGIVVVNFQDPERTREIYAQLTQALEQSQ
jgi:hypothetical protein